MPSKVFSAAVAGLNAQLIEVETDTSYGLRSFEIVGLPDKAVQEWIVPTKQPFCVCKYLVDS